MLLKNMLFLTIGFATIGGPLIGSFTKMFSGWITDVTLVRLPRMWILTLANIFQAVVLAICIIAADDASVIILLTVSHYMGLLNL